MPTQTREAIVNTKLGTGQAVGQFIFGVRDGADADDLPEVIPAQGRVTITPNIAQSASVELTPNPVIMWLTPTELILNAEGYACLPDPEDATKPGKAGVRLFANDDPRIGVTNWNYTVTVELTSADGKFVGTMDPFQIFIPTGAGDSPENPAVDMAHFAPVPSSVGIGTTQAVTLVARAEKAAAVALDVQRRADAGEFIGAPGKTMVAEAAAAAVNANPKIMELEASRWLRAQMPVVADFNDYTTPGSYPVTSTDTKANIPFPFSGTLNVTKPPGKLIQEYVTDEVIPRSKKRRQNAGVWGAWYVSTPYSASPPRGTDFNTLLDWGTSQVNWIDHPNQPFPAVGTLEILPSGLDTLQRFTTRETIPRTAQRTSTSSTGFRPWVRVNEAELNQLGERVTSLEAETGGGPQSADPTVPVRGAMKPWNPTLTASNPAEIINVLSKDRLIGYNGSHSGGKLKETRDGGATWTDLYTFPGSYGWVEPLENGELLAVVQNDPSPRELWLSSGYAKGYSTGPVTWSKVLTASSPYITFARAWAVSIYKNMIFVNEYGPKANQTVGSYVAPDGMNARYTYMSLDFGKTWKTIFDLNAFLQGRPGVDHINDVHLHGVAWDPYWDRIWITFGDARNGTIYSDDLGRTWQVAHLAVTYSGGHQNVGIVPLPKAILFGSDGYPNGVQRITRDQGKHSDLYTIDQAYTINPGVDRLTHLCQAILKVEREGGDGPVLFGFSAETSIESSHIVATVDGYTFTKLWEDPVKSPVGRGIRAMAGPTLQGELIVSSNDGRVANAWSKWQGPLGIY